MLQRRALWGSAARARAFATRAERKATAAFTVTPSGLQYRDELVGEGEPPQRGQTVHMHYTGTLEDGTQFDSSRGGGRQPLDFAVGTGKVC